MKKDFETYFAEISGKTPETFGLPVEFLMNLRKYYAMGVGLQQVITGSIPRHKAESWLNSQLRNTYKIQLHGIGKNPYQRFYDRNDRFSWLKVEHFLIVHMYSIKKDESYIRNKTIAAKIGWIRKNETDPETIAKAERKVGDALQIIKNDRKTFSIEQHHNPCESGSYHVIRANWLEIIPLYSLYDPDKAFSIRMRKGVRYRIFSLIKTTIKSFSEGLKRLMKLQRNKYLTGLITMDEIEFKTAKDIWRILIRDAGLEAGYFDDLDLIMPEYQDGKLILNVKTKNAYSHILRSLNLLKRTMKQAFNRELVAIPRYMIA